jgi:hypothetical protein
MKRKLLTNRAYKAGAISALCKLGVYVPHLQNVMDPLLTVAQGTGLEAVKGDTEEEQINNALMGGTQSTGGVLLEEVPWTRILQNNLRKLVALAPKKIPTNYTVDML